MINPFERGINDSKKAELIYHQIYSQIIKPYQAYLSQIIQEGIGNDALLSAISPIWNQQSQIYDELVERKRKVSQRRPSLRKRLEFRIAAQAKILEELNDPTMIRIGLEN